MRRAAPHEYVRRAADCCRPSAVRRAETDRIPGNGGGPCSCPNRGSDACVRYASREDAWRGLENPVVGDGRRRGVGLKANARHANRRLEEVEDVVVINQVARVVVWAG